MVTMTLERAIQLQKDGKISEALEIYRELMRKKQYKTDPYVLAEYGMLHYLTRNIDDAEKYLKKSIEYGNDVNAYTYLALIENERDNLEEAERFIDRAMRLAEDCDLHRWFVHGLIKLRLGKVEAASISLRDTLDEPSERGLSRRMRGARQKLGHVLKKDPPDWLKLGVIYEGLGRNQEARHAYRVATKATPEDADTWLLLAGTLTDQWEYDETIRMGREHAPDNVELMLLEAESFYDFGMEYEAFRMFEKIPGPIAEEWVERLTEEFNEELDAGGYNHWLGEYGANDEDYYYDDYY